VGNVQVYGLACILMLTSLNNQVSLPTYQWTQHPMQWCLPTRVGKAPLDPPSSARSECEARCSSGNALSGNTRLAGRSRNSDHKTQFWMSHSHHWVCCGPGHATPSFFLFLFFCWCSQIILLKTPLSGKALTAHWYPTILGKWPHPLHQKLSISTRIWIFYRVGVVNWAVLIKKNVKLWAFLVFNNEDLSHLPMNPIQPPEIEWQNRVRPKLRRSGGCVELRQRQGSGSGRADDV